MDPTRFLHSRWHGIFEPAVGLVPKESVELFTPGKTVYTFRRVSDLSMSLHNVGGDRAALVQMPPPERSPEAYFVCVVENGARIFTLEAEASDEHPGEGIVCEWTKEGEHRNFGIGVPANQEAFLKAVTALVQAPGARAAASCTPRTDGASPPITHRAGGDLPTRPQSPSGMSGQSRPDPDDGWIGTSRRSLYAWIGLGILCGLLFLAKAPYGALMSAWLIWGISGCWLSATRRWQSNGYGAAFVLSMVFPPIIVIVMALPPRAR